MTGGAGSGERAELQLTLHKLRRQSFCGQVSIDQGWVWHLQLLREWAGVCAWRAAAHWAGMLQAAATSPARALRLRLALEQLRPWSAGWARWWTLSLRWVGSRGS